MWRVMEMEAGTAKAREAMFETIGTKGWGRSLYCAERHRTFHSRELVRRVSMEGEQPERCLFFNAALVV